MQDSETISKPVSIEDAKIKLAEEGIVLSDKQVEAVLKFLYMLAEVSEKN